MSTKVAAVVKGITEKNGETFLLIAIEANLTASLEKEDRVYLEVTKALTGDKVEFYRAPVTMIKAQEEQVIDLPKEEEKPEEIIGAGPTIEAVEQPSDESTPPDAKPEEQ